MLEQHVFRFDECYQERIWGGQRLASAFGKPVDTHARIGEAWLVSDHPVHESHVAEGRYAGESLHTLLERYPQYLLGRRASVTRLGRFPLLLKLLDAAETLSVQVHPDDDAAVRLNESDSGKTEMWHVLQADAESRLYGGLAECEDGAKQPAFASPDWQPSPDVLCEIPAEAGQSVFVPAGTVHAIGSGILLAEIQQNSDVTYRVYDWGRLGRDGEPRALHLDRASACTDSSARVEVLGDPIQAHPPGAEIDLLCACTHFATERIRWSGTFRRDSNSSSFHILLLTQGRCIAQTAQDSVELLPGQAAGIAGGAPRFLLEGEGTCLDYYVPDMGPDIEARFDLAASSLETLAALPGGLLRTQSQRSAG